MKGAAVFIATRAITAYEMLPTNIVALPLMVLLVYSNESQPSPLVEWAPRGPRPLQPPGRWSTSTWGECSNPCGRGEEQRQVSCVLEDVTGTLIVATDGFCAPPRPTSARQCYQYQDECTNAWVTGDWGQCSAKCGGGQRWRPVECRGSSTTSSGTSSVLPHERCVSRLRPDERRTCNLHPCPDGRRALLRTEHQHHDPQPPGQPPGQQRPSKPRRIRLFSKFTLRCPFAVYWTPDDDRSKRKYAWYKDGQRLPLHEDKYTQTDNKGELRVKGADEPDSGVYMCASLTANPRGKTHNITVTLERVPGEPTATPTSNEDSGEVPSSGEQEDVVGATTISGTATVEQGTTSGETGATIPNEPPPSTTTTTPTAPTALADPDSGTEASPAPAGRRRRREEVIVAAARYDATPFSECSATCGAAGLRQRAVRCVDNETGAQLPLAACEDLGPPPPPQEACNRVDCPPRWVWPSWSDIKCSRPCGRGSKRRRGQCSQTLAGGAEAALEAARCEGGEAAAVERKDCNRAACKVLLHVGEHLQLACNATNVTWRYGEAALDSRLAGDRYFADNDTGKLYVYEVDSRDTGQYNCIQEEDDGTVSIHRYDVEVVPLVRPASDEFFYRACHAAPEEIESTTATATNSAGNTPTESEDLPTTSTEPSIPWHRLLTPAAEGRGRVLGVFT